MLFLGAAIIVLWFLLMRPGLARMDAKMAARVLKLAGAAFAICAAIAVMLRGHFDLALLLGGGGLWLYSLANKTSAQAGDASRQSKVSRVRSAIIEMEFDSVTGVMRGLVLAGPDEGRLLDHLTQAQCEGVYALCRAADPEGARLLEAYFDRRFASWRQTGQGDSDPRRDRARQSNRMSEDEAYEVLGLRRGAARDDVVRSHRSLMKKLHPDQGGSTDSAARVNEAKEVLMRRHT